MATNEVEEDGSKAAVSAQVAQGGRSEARCPLKLRQGEPSEELDALPRPAPCRRVGGRVANRVRLDPSLRADHRQDWLPATGLRYEPSSAVNRIVATLSLDKQKMPVPWIVAVPFPSPRNSWPAVDRLAGQIYDHLIIEVGIANHIKTPLALVGRSRHRPNAPVVPSPVQR